MDFAVMRAVIVFVRAEGEFQVAVFPDFDAVVVSVLPAEGVLDGAVEVEVGAIGGEAEASPDGGRGAEEFDTKDEASGSVM